MSHRSSSSSRVRCFRPTLEILEDRTVPSTIGDQLANFGQGLAKSATGLVQVAAVNADVLLFNLNPTPGNFISLLVDSVKLDQTVQALSVNVQTLTTAVQGAEEIDADATKLGLPPVIFTPAEKSLVDSIVSTAQSTLSFFQNAVNDAFANVLTAYFFFVGQGPAKLAPLPTPPSTSPGPTTGGGYGATYTDAPPSASASGPDITESAFITASAGNDAPITATITYSATDGTSGGPVTKTIAPGASQTLSLTVMPCSAGVVGTWTVTIDGHVDHTNTTTFTP